MLYKEVTKRKITISSLSISC